jgi:hypothetical protein
MEHTRNGHSSTRYDYNLMRLYANNPLQQRGSMQIVSGDGAARSSMPTDLISHPAHI